MLGILDFIGDIFFAIVGYIWHHYAGDVSHGRLMAIGFENAPTEFHFLQIVAPVFLLILTRLKTSVSTTFICLTAFATVPAEIGKILAKTMSGYVLAFFVFLAIS